MRLQVSTEKRKSVPSPLIGLIAEKNEKEKIGMKNAHIRDGVIFCNLMAHIETEVFWTKMKLIPGTN